MGDHEALLQLAIAWDDFLLENDGVALGRHDDSSGSIALEIVFFLLTLVRQIKESSCESKLSVRHFAEIWGEERLFGS